MEELINYVNKLVLCPADDRYLLTAYLWNSCCEIFLPNAKLKGTYIVWNLFLTRNTLEGFYFSYDGHKNNEIVIVCTKAKGCHWAFQLRDLQSSEVCWSLKVNRDYLATNNNIKSFYRGYSKIKICSSPIKTKIVNPQGALSVQHE